MSKFGEPKENKKRKVFSVQEFFAWSRKNFAKILGILALLFAGFIGVFIYQNVSTTYTGTEINVTDSTSIIDVRPFAEFNKQHVDGAMDMDYSSGGFDNYLKQLDKSKSYIVYGADAKQSKEVVAYFKKQGFENVIDGETVEITSKKTGLKIVGITETNVSSPETSTTSPTVVPTASSNTPFPTPTGTFTPIIVNPTASPTPSN